MDAPLVERAPAAGGQAAAPTLGLRMDNEALRVLPVDAELRNFRRHAPGVCLSRVAPTPVAAPKLRCLVPEVAALLGLRRDADGAPVDDDQLAALLAGNARVAGSEPWAWRYGGHQFGHWAGQLGDGRAITLGEVVVGAGGADGAGERWEIALKGAGPTPYSRSGDGRAVLRSSVRELICSEAMAHLGVPTTRALSLVTTGEPVVRDMFYDGNARPEPGAVVCRVAPSFLRVGHLQILAAHGELDALRAMLGYALRRDRSGLFDPAALRPDREGALALLESVCRSSAALVVHWQRVGFVHGVLNTDNLSLHGVTIDYGPYGWLEGFDPDWTPNTTDAHGRRYRFGAQPEVVQWNVLQLANALYPIVEDVPALEAALATYADTFAPAHDAMLADKLGLPRPGTADADPDLDGALIEGLGAVLGGSEVDMTLFYRGLAGVVAVPAAGAGGGSGDGDSAGDGAGDGAGDDDALLDVLRPALYAPADLDADGGAYGRVALGWLRRYRARLRQLGRPDADRAAAMNAVNPAIVPRNYLAQLAIDRAEQGDDGGIHELLDALRRPYEEPADPTFMAKRPEWARHRAGCSMLSCSS